METSKDPYQITDIAALERLYGQPAVAALKKEIDYLHPHYRAFIDAAPFVVLATGGRGGLDVTPRGDPAGFVQVRDDKTLWLPDRRGNNRIDSLRNIVEDPRVALLFMIPGIGEMLRVNGHARILVDPGLLKRFEMDGKPPRSVLEIHVESVFFQCSRAVMRSGLWQADRHTDRGALPGTGTLLQDLSGGEIDGAQYDRDLPGRLQSTLY